jgi:hypothetical protein
MAMFGLTIADSDKRDDICSVLPENVQALEWFLKLQTQWRVSFGGLMGLDYGVFIMMAKDEGMRGRERAEVLEDLRMMEGVYLEVVREAKGDG